MSTTQPNDGNNSNNGCFNLIGKVLSSAIFIGIIELFRKEIRCFLNSDTECKGGLPLPNNETFIQIISVISIISFFIFKWLGIFMCLFLFINIVAAISKVENTDTFQAFFISLFLILSFRLAFINYSNKYYLLIIGVGFYSLIFSVIFGKGANENTNLTNLILIVSVICSIFIFPKI